VLLVSGVRLGAVKSGGEHLLVRVIGLSGRQTMLVRVLMVAWFVAVMAVALLPQPTGVSWV
jgi:hypothetical protein